MKTTGTQDEAAGSDIGLHGQKAALQVICLGSSGGPSEENVSGLLVRSLSSDWARNSVLAVDAGSHLAPITRILERDFPSISADRSTSTSEGSNASSHRRSTSPADADDEQPPKPEPNVLSTGPFAGLKFPHESARANALHILRTHISTYLITHPHLDHLSGFAINTAAFAATSRPKTLAALPSTVNAIKAHIFNDVIWPNLTDEDGGVGFVTFQRLKEGGDVMVGEGEGRGYIDVCDGLGVRAFKVSHGVCTKSPPSHQHRGSIAAMSDSQVPPYNGSIQGTSQDPISAVNMNRSLSITALHSQPGTPGGTQRHLPSPRLQATPDTCVVDSTAFFLRDEETQREALIFGDVEPDSISLTPRTFVVWQEAARKIAQRVLGGIFIECSYDDSQADAVLFGHLNPRHLIAELQSLAAMVTEAKAARAADKSGKKRKRSGQAHASGPNGVEHVAARMAIPETAQKRSKTIAARSLPDDRRRSSALSDYSLPDGAATNANASSSPDSTDPLNHYQFQISDTMKSFSEAAASPRSVSFPTKPINSVTSNGNGNNGGGNNGHGAGAGAGSGTVDRELPLSGIKIIIIHIKDTLKDGPHVSESILADLLEHEERLQEQGQGLGCEFIISQSGESYWF